jgi:hypothetical protein
MRFKILTTVLACLLLAGGLYAQTSLTSTTFSAAVAATDTTVTVASATGISAPSGNASLGSLLVAGQEVMKVTEVSGTTITVQRGYGTHIYAHASGATVYEGQSGEFASYEPYGACTAGTTWPYTPLIVLGTGNIWTCSDSIWQNTNTNPDPVTLANVGTANTGVTATEYGDGRRHVTKLTFSALALAPATAADAEAAGVLLYTLPAGAVIVNSASISVGVYGSGASCDADTPDLGLGTVIASGDTAVLSGTATFEDILTGQTANDCDGTVELKTLSQGLGIETAGAHTVHLNVADTWAAICTITATGTVWIEWTLLD